MMYKTEKITIDSQEIIIKPLKGKYFAKFMKAASKMKKGDSTTEMSAEDISEESIATFHELGVVSLETAYKDAGIIKSLDEVEYTVTSFFKIILQAVSSVNTPDE